MDKIKFFFKLIVSLLLIYFLINKLDINSIQYLGWKFLFPFTISICINLIALFLMSIRWKLLCIEFLKIQPESKFLYRFYLIGSFFNIFLPGAIGGDVMRTRMLIKKYLVSIKSATYITLSERILGLYGLFLLLGLGMLFRTFPEKMPYLSQLSNYFFYLFLLFLLLLLPFVKKILAVKNIKISLVFILQTIFILLIAQFGDIIVANIFISFMDVHIPFTAVIFIMPLVYLATVMPISLGGLGVREGTFAGLMLLYGVPVSTSVLIALSMYLVKVVVGIIGSYIYLKEKNNDK